MVKNTVELPVDFLFPTIKISLLHSKDIKKGQRSDPTFVNLKSNTMKTRCKVTEFFEINNRKRIKMSMLNVFYRISFGLAVF